MPISYKKQELYIPTVKDLKVFLKCVPDDTLIVEELGDEYVVRLMEEHDEVGDITQYVTFDTEPL